MYIPELPDQMRAARYTRRLSQPEAARAVGIAAVTYGGAERTGRMSPKTARAIEKWLRARSTVHSPYFLPAPGVPLKRKRGPNAKRRVNR